MLFEPLGGASLNNAILIYFGLQNRFWHNYVFGDYKNEPKKYPKWSKGGPKMGLK